MSTTFLLLLSVLLLSLSPTSPSSPHPHHRHHRSPPQQNHQQQQQQQQLSDLISALLATSDFQTWASLLVSLLPLNNNNATATVFLPSDAAISHLPTFFDPFLIPYHVVPNLRLSSSRLRTLPPLSRLPTLLPRRSLLLSNFTVNHSPLSRPDLFLSPSFAVHGIPNVLLYSLHPDALPNATADASDDVLLSPPPRPMEVEVGSVWVSRAAASADGFLLLFRRYAFGSLILVLGCCCVR